jgi:hypothetical protein
MAEIGKLPLKKLRAELAQLEARHGMTSAEFYDRWVSGLVGDTPALIPDAARWFELYEAAVLKGFPAPPEYVAAIKAVREGPRRPAVVLTPEVLKEELAKCEAEHGMTSAEFYDRWLSGQAGDSHDAFYWAFLCDVAVKEGVLARPDHVRA